MIIYVANSRYGSPTRTPHQKSQRILHQPNQIWPTDLLKQETSPYKSSDSRQKPNGTPIIRSPKTPKHPVLGPLCMSNLSSSFPYGREQIMHTTVPSRFPIHKISTTVITLPRKRFLIHGSRRNIVGPHTGASYDAYNQHQSPHLQSWANFF